MEKKMSLRKDITNLYRFEMETPFTISEYRERIYKVREEMVKKKIDLLYCTTSESLYYLTGYQSVYYNPFYPDGIAIRQDEDDFIFFAASTDGVLIQVGTIATDLCLYDRDELRTQGMIEFVIHNLKQKGWLKGTVGLEKWGSNPDMNTIELLEAALEKENCKLVDGSAIVREIRTIKSTQELAYVRKAATIADIGLKAGINAINPGVSEIEIAGEIDYAMSKAEGENPSIPTMVHTGSRTACPHGVSSRRNIMPGDMITIDVAGVYNRYHSDLGRTISVGEPHKEVAKVIDLAVKSWPVFLESIKPNCPMAEVTKTLEDYYRKAGIWEDRWLCGGYDLGCSFPPSWVGFFYYDSNETRKPSGRLFSPGTVVNYEANFYLPQGEGLSLLVDTITVSESGAEVMSKISPDLIIK